MKKFFNSLIVKLIDSERYAVTEYTKLDLFLIREDACFPARKLLLGRNLKSIILSNNGFDLLWLGWMFDKLYWKFDLTLDEIKTIFEIEYKMRKNAEIGILNSRNCINKTLNDNEVFLTDLITKYIYNEPPE